MELKGLDAWTKIEPNELSTILPNDVNNEIDVLFVTYKLIGFDVRVSKLIRNDENRYSLNFIVNNARVCMIFVFEKDGKFKKCDYTLFALIGTKLYEDVAEKYGIFDWTFDVIGIIPLLKKVRNVLDRVLES